MITERYREELEECVRSIERMFTKVLYSDTAYLGPCRHDTLMNGGIKEQGSAAPEVCEHAHEAISSYMRTFRSYCELHGGDVLIWRWKPTLDTAKRENPVCLDPKPVIPDFEGYVVYSRLSIIRIPHVDTSWDGLEYRSVTNEFWRRVG